METISRGLTFGDFVTIRTEGSNAGRHGCMTSEYRLPSSPSFKCNVLRESLSVDNQNIPCATLKRSGSWVISVYLCIYSMPQRRPSMRVLVLRFLHH